ncbi:AP180 N-terminal homology (ANTH) domain [Dillenia turbinata]|uniref:AP180 N-terminal homology (ANTH) domain n=1 Tax=Dillenia turbinata TaxID=194707 RepID=A0AAN8VU64_9MAGN
MVGYKNRLILRFVSLLKDKAAFARASLCPNTRKSSIRLAVLRVTTHNPSSAPSEDSIAAVLALGDASRSTACACIVALMDRLQKTRSSYVALKCLILAHSIISNGSFILKDQLSVYPLSGGRNFLNLSTFLDKSNVESWELSSWVRWYAGVIESNLQASRVLGSSPSSSSQSNVGKNDIGKEDEKISGLTNSELLREIDGLTIVIEEICKAPESTHMQVMTLVHEVMRLVGENYMLVHDKAFVRLDEMEDRMDMLSYDESIELLSCLRRLLGCRQRLLDLFVNKKKKDPLWDMIEGMTERILRMKKEREERMLVVVGRREEGTDLTRCNERVIGLGQVDQFPSSGYFRLGVDGVLQTVSN